VIQKLAIQERITPLFNTEWIEEYKRLVELEINRLERLKQKLDSA